MKILAIHSDFIEFQAKKKAFAKAEEGVSEEKKRVEECLVIFTAAEKSDESSGEEIKAKYVSEVKSILGQVRAERVVLYPYAHLSSSLSKPSFAEKLMKDAEAALRAEGVEVYRAPFGWYKSFNISCKGHPLSELSRQIGVGGESASSGVASEPAASSSGSVSSSGQKVSLKREGKDEAFVFHTEVELDAEQKLSYSVAALVGLAVSQLYPGSEVGSIGFSRGQAYVDIAGVKLKQDDLNRVTKKVKELRKGELSFTKFGGKLSGLQKEINADLGESAVSYELGGISFVPLYKEPFVASLAEIAAFKLLSSGSAYWKNNENNRQLARVYCVAFASQADKEAWEAKRKEAENRSHIKIGKEQGLFVISDLVGAGLPLIAPKGMIIRKEIVDYLWSLHSKHNYKWVWTPHIAKEALYKTSGHWDKFGDELFKVRGKSDAFIMKPMNCPHHMQIFDSFSLSYRDMPIRFFEPATIYRDEKSGQLHGLTRVRSITQDDGHLFCRKEQIGQEVAIVVSIVREFYATVGMNKEYWVSFSVRGDDKSKYLGGDDVWELAEGALEKAAVENNLPFKKIKGEAAFYGPKLDFMFKDSLGREWQLATIQCDFNLPERFNLSFMNEEGKRERPVVIHRAISGSLERFMGILIEHYAGKFPLWLSPVQVKLLTVTDRSVEFARSVATKMQAVGLRVSVDDRTETIGKKVREAQLEQANYILTIGDKEVDQQNLAVRSRDTGKVEFGVAVDAFIAKIVAEKNSRA